MSGADRVAAYLTEHRGSLPRAPEDVLADLVALESLVGKWQKVQNLVSRETPGEFWTRHVLDSIQLLPLLGDARRVLDLGSGGGFPALPLAVCAVGEQRTFALVESNGRKCAFLNAAKREFTLPIAVHSARIEMFRPEVLPDVVTARALASLKQLFTWMPNLVGPDTRLLLHKGRDYREELAELDSVARSNVVVHPSLSDSEGVILEWPAGTLTF